ncbi:MAG: ABC transporter ATP-binding protein [Phototrophicales bacterium]|nr:MAG: ABC transporter ATP-binding protein [Phototrophicales bacterium]
MRTILTTQNLSIGYKRPRKIVAEALNLELKSGELVCLLGPNGVGKSTLLRTIAAMQRPLAGYIFLGQHNIHDLSPRQRAQLISIVLTERVDNGLLTGYELVALGRYPYTDFSGRLSVQDKTIITWAIQAVGGTALAARPLNMLSDGERQKMMIARALAQDPSLMLLDEPTAFLDLPRRVELMRLLRHLAEDTQRAILVSTHDLELALQSAHRLWLMNTQGIIQEGAPEDLVLNGALQNTFAQNGLIFDAESGTFKLHQQDRGCVTLLGEGLPYLWTQRALAREGFQIIPNASIVIEAYHQHWRLLKNQCSLEYYTLYDLMNALKDQQSE